MTTDRHPLSADGFRPFFLLAAGMAALWIPAWVELFAGTLPADPYLGTTGWHRHEMLLGYTAAVLAGFLLTATRSWTGLPTLSGRPLLALAALWVAGRLAMLAPSSLPVGLAALVDGAFLPLLGAALAVPLVRARDWRNLAFLPFLLALTAANAVVHLEALGHLERGGAAAIAFTLDLMVVVMVVIGGRVIPYFTRRALAEDGLAPSVRLAWTSNGAVLAMALAGLVAAPAALRAGLTALAALATGARLVSWQRRGVWSRPILWVLHLGYAWVVAGLAFRAWAELDPGVPVRLGVHLFTAGGIGTLTLGMMSRVALGHTGRPLEVARPVVGAFVLVCLAAGIRVLAPILAPEHYEGGLRTAGALWSLGFGLYLLVYRPILLGPRVDAGA